MAGGNIILQADTAAGALDAARRASQALAHMPGVITPFPGGVARSGSKVGSRYKALRASTADAYCPTLRGRVATQLHEGVNCAYEIVIDGCDEASVAGAMATAIRAAAGPGVLAIGAGNYGGKLGKFHFRLHDVLRRGRSSVAPRPPWSRPVSTLPVDEATGRTPSYDDRRPLELLIS